MAGAAGCEKSGLIAQLKENPRHFSQGQALRLLGYLHSSTMEEGSDFIRNHIRIRPWLSLAFPNSALTAIEEDERGDFLLDSTAAGLYSTLGPLPTFYTEELLDEARQDESVSRDFLDILNNHLYHLAYAAARHNSLALRSLESPREGMRHIQFCLMGDLTPSAMPRAVLTELLAHRSRSASSLESYLSYVLHRSDISVEQCVERRVAIPADQRCRLGQANAVLGENAMLGAEVRDYMGKFRLHFHEVTPDDMRRYLPERPAYRALVEQVQSFLNTPLEFELILHPLPEQGGVQLGVNGELGFYLGEARQPAPVKVTWKSF